MKKITKFILFVLLISLCFSLFTACGKKSDIISVSPEQLIEYANESSSIWEFLQRFFTNSIVYKDSSGKFALAPIEKKLSRNDYDWDNLVNIGLDTKDFRYMNGDEVISLKGIDVSSYQEKIDWTEVAKTDVDYAIIRLGYRGYSSGKLIKDSFFDDNMNKALKEGIPCGVYFVTRAVSKAEIDEEFDFVMEGIFPYNVSWPIVLDLESAGADDARDMFMTAEERTELIVYFCEKIKAVGYTPCIYSNIGYFLNKLELSELTKYDIWFAQYFNRPFFPYEFTMWQYTDCGSVSGIKGNVDLSISMFDYGAD